jgi:hypothetical protein
VGLLALVAGQDVEPAEDSEERDGRRRIARRTVADRTVSTVDADARHIRKNRTRHQDGFRGHASFEPETAAVHRRRCHQRLWRLAVRSGDGVCTPVDRS